MNILSEYLKYRKSKHKQAYKEIGKQYRVSGFYVYRIAHGHDLGDEFDEDIRFDLNEKLLIIYNMRGRDDISGKERKNADKF